MKEITSKIPALPTQIQKKAERIFKKYEHSAVKQIQKVTAESSHHTFFTQNFLGKKIASFFFHKHLRAAEMALVQQNWEECEKKLHLAMRWNSQDVDAWFLAVMLNVQIHPEKNISSASCVLQLNPDIQQARLLRARMEMKTQRLFPAAIVDWYRILEASPELAEAWFQIGILFSKMRDFPNARIFLTRAMELEPMNFAIPMKLMENLLVQKDYGRANEFCGELVTWLMKNISDNSHESAETPEQRKILLEKKVAETQDTRLEDFYLEILLKRLLILEILRKMDDEIAVCEEALLYKDLKGTREKNQEESSRWVRHSTLMQFARNNLSEIYFQKKQWADALPLLMDRIRDSDETNEVIHYAIVCLNQLEKQEELLDLCTELIAKGTKNAEIYHSHGIMLLMNGQLDEGLVELRKAVKLDPMQFEYWFNLSKLLLMKNQLSEAVDALEHVLALRPGMLYAGLTLIQVLDQLERKDEALDAIERLIRNIPGNVDGLILKGDFLVRQEKFQEAKDAYSEALKLDPDHPIARIGRAQIWQREENWQNAYDDASKAIKTAPEITGFYLHRAQYAANLRNFSQAQSDLRHFMAKEPDDLRAVLLLGEIQLEMKKPEAAIVLFQKILAQDPHCVHALIRCAEAKASLNLLEPALRDVELAIQIKPDDEEIKILRIQLLLKLQREPEALEYCTSILEQNPESVPFHYNRGAILLNSHHPEEALPDFEWVCDQNPDSVQPQFARALALNALFRHEEAMEALNRVLEIQPDFAPALSEKAMTHSFLGDPKHSLALLDRILEKNPEDVRLLNLRGTVLANEQRVEEAAEDFQKAVDIQPDYAPALNNLGHMQMLLGNLEQGIESLTQGIACNPQWGRPHLNRAIIYMRMFELANAENDISEAQRKAQEAGDEDVLVDAIELRRKIEILKKFMGPDEQEDFNPEHSLWNDEDSEDFHEDFDPNSIFEQDEESDGSGFLKRLFESFRNGEDEEKDENDYLNLEDSDDEQDDESDDASMNELDDELDDEMDENPDDFDFSVDSENEIANLTSDFMQVEEFFGDNIPKNAEIGKNLWPKIEKLNEEGTTPDAKETGIHEREGDFPVEMMLNYIDLASEEDSGKQESPNPAQIQQATDFLSSVFQLWDSEKQKAETSENEEKKEKGKFLPPIIINCPEILQKFPQDSLKSFGANASASADFQIPMVSYIRYKKNREFFFEQLTAISEMLDQALQNAETPDQKRIAKYHKKEFKFLMELIMHDLINNENEILLVITNFLNSRLMNGLSG